MTLGSIRPVLGVKIQKNIFFFVKMIFFSFGYFMAPMIPFRRIGINGKRMPNSKSAHQITPGGAKTRKMTYDVIKGH